MSQKIAFAKMNGIGNKIIVADMRARADHVTPAAAIALAAETDTHFDQLMAVHGPGPIGKDAIIEIFNSDGSKAEACGNGTRCVVQWLHRQTGGQDFSFEVEGQPLKARLNDDGSVSVNMGVPRFDWDAIPLAYAMDTSSMPVGWPHENGALETPMAVNVGKSPRLFRKWRRKVS